MGGLKYLIGSTAAALALGAPAAAQERKLDFDLDALLVYDSKFARSSEAVAALRGIEPEELRFSPALTVSAEIPVGRHLLFARVLAGYDFHVNNPIFDRERLEGRAGFRAWLGRCASTIEGRLARRQTQLEDIFLGPVDNAETVKEAILVADCPDVVAGLAPAVEFSGRWTDNSNPVRASTDSDSRRAEGRLAYRRPSLGEIGVYAAYQETDYPNRLLAFPGGIVADSFEARTFGLRFSRELGTLLRGTVSIGHTNVDTPLRSGAFDGLTWSALLLINPQGRLRPTLQAEKAVLPSNQIGVSYQLDESYRADIDYLLSGRVTLNARVSYRDRRYQVAPFGPAPFVTRDKTWLVAGGLTYAIGPRLVLDLEVQRENRDTDNPLFDYTSTRIALSTRATF